MNEATTRAPLVGGYYDDEPKHEDPPVASHKMASWVFRAAVDSAPVSLTPVERLFVLATVPKGPVSRSWLTAPFCNRWSFEENIFKRIFLWMLLHLAYCMGVLLLRVRTGGISDWFDAKPSPTYLQCVSTQSAATTFLISFYLNQCYLTMKDL